MFPSPPHSSGRLTFAAEAALLLEARVLRRELVTTLAMRGTRRTGVLPQEILALSYGFQVRWVTARRSVAQMIHHEFSWNPAVGVLVGEAVSRDRSTVHRAVLVVAVKTKRAISLSLQCPLPRPARFGTSDLHHCPKSLARRASLWSSFHGYIVPDLYLHRVAATRFA